MEIVWAGVVTLLHIDDFEVVLEFTTSFGDFGVTTISLLRHGVALGVEIFALVTDELVSVGSLVFVLHACRWELGRGDFCVKGCFGSE